MINIDGTHDDADDAYYFAYGSNLNPERMNNRKAFFKNRKLGKLLHYEFVINKVTASGTLAANIRPKYGATVYGALYKCTQETLVALDLFEKNYSRQKFNIITEGGDVTEAIAYIAGEENCSDTLNIVSKDYLEHILCGRDILPADYVVFLESFLPMAVSNCPWDEYVDAACQLCSKGLLFSEMSENSCGDAYSEIILQQSFIFSFE